MASSLEEKLSIMLDKGSALKGKTRCQTQEVTWSEAHIGHYLCEGVSYALQIVKPFYFLRSLRWGPAHQRVLPALPGVKVQLPRFVVASRLHGCFGRNKDVNLPCFDVLLRDPCQGGDVLRDRNKAHPAVSQSGCHNGEHQELKW